MTYQVQRRDTLWARAERHLGDPLRYPEIIARNPTAVGPDNEIYPGTVLVLPSDATGLTPPGNSLESSAVPPLEEVTVEPGDTLWDLAEELTGDGGNWRQAWELNRGRTEPGRATFTDPSLIRPGWTLSIPNPVGNAEPEPEPSPPRPAPAEPAPTEPTTPSSDEPTTSVPAPVTPTPASPGTAAPTAETSATPQNDRPANETSGLPVAAYTGGAGVSLT
jgi:LysM repeat protein